MVKEIKNAKEKTEGFLDRPISREEALEKLEAMKILANAMKEYSDKQVE